MIILTSFFMSATVICVTASSDSLMWIVCEYVFHENQELHGDLNATSNSIWIMIICDCLLQEYQELTGKLHKFEAKEQEILDHLSEGRCPVEGDGTNAGLPIDRWVQCLDRLVLHSWLMGAVLKTSVCCSSSWLVGAAQAHVWWWLHKLMTGGCCMSSWLVGASRVPDWWVLHEFITCGCYHNDTWVISVLAMICLYIQF